MNSREKKGWGERVKCIEYGAESDRTKSDWNNEKREFKEIIRDLIIRHSRESQEKKLNRKERKQKKQNHNSQEEKNNSNKNQINAHLPISLNHQKHKK